MPKPFVLYFDADFEWGLYYREEELTRLLGRHVLDCGFDRNLDRKILTQCSFADFAECCDSTNSKENGDSVYPV
jgi:hypothetical protein